MTFSAKLGFKNPSSSQDLNETQAKIISKGIYDGGALGLSGVNLNITIAPFVAVGYDGMVVVSDATETVTVVDGQINYIVLLAKYERRATPTMQFQVIDDVSWAASIHSDYFINWARVDLSAGGFSGVTAAEVFYNEADWSEKVGGGNWKSAVATVGALPTLYNKDGDIRMVMSGYKPYVWRAGTQVWEEAFDSEAALVSYDGGANWHDGTTNPATTVEGQLDKIITDLVGETGGGGADKLGCGARSTWLDTVTNPVGSIFDALEKIVTDLSAITGAAKLGCSSRTSWHDSTTNPNSSIYAAIEKIITDLVNNSGSDRIGSAAVSAFPQSLSVGSIKDQLAELLGYINLNDTDPGWAMNLIDSDHAGAYSGQFNVAYHGGTGTLDDKYFVLAGTDGEIETSNYGLTWTKETQAGAFSGWFNGGCYATSIDQFLLVGASGEIQTSDGDVSSWTNRTPDASYSDDFRAACWSETLDLYVIVGDSGEIQTSPDGTTWTHRAPAASYSGDFRCALWSDNLGLFIIAGTSGEIQTSVDGTTWTHRSAASGTPTYIGITEGVGQVVLISSSVIHGSANGITWYERDTNSNQKLIVYGNGLFLIPAYIVTFGSPHWYSSRDGITWEDIELTLDTSDFKCAAYGFNRFVFAGDTSYNPCIQATHRHG